MCGINTCDACACAWLSMHTCTNVCGANVSCAHHALQELQYMHRMTNEDVTDDLLYRHIKVGLDSCCSVGLDSCCSVGREAARPFELRHGCGTISMRVCSEERSTETVAGVMLHFSVL